MSHEHNHDYHNHVDEQGQLVKCYHECKSQFSTMSFWVLMTISFPFEHAIWEYVFPWIWAHLKQLS